MNNLKMASKQSGKAKNKTVKFANFTTNMATCMYQLLNDASLVIQLAIETTWQKTR